MRARLQAAQGGAGRVWLRAAALPEHTASLPACPAWPISPVRAPPRIAPPPTRGREDLWLQGRGCVGPPHAVQRDVPCLLGRLLALLHQAVHVGHLWRRQGRVGSRTGRKLSSQRLQHACPLLHSRHCALQPTNLPRPRPAAFQPTLNTRFLGSGSLPLLLFCAPANSSCCTCAPLPTFMYRASGTSSAAHRLWAGRVWRAGAGRGGGGEVQHRMSQQHSRRM